MDTKFAPATEGPPVRFKKGALPPVVLLVSTSIWFVVVPLVFYPLVDSPLLAFLAQSTAFAVVIGIAWAMLRWEGVSLPDVGLSRQNVLPGVIPVVIFYVFLNAAGAMAAFLSVGSVSVAITDGTSLSSYASQALVQLLFVGIAEELAYRAYLQNKLIALLGGSHDRLRKAGAILLGASLFTLLHIPQRLFIQGLASPVEVAQTLVVVLLLGALLGVIYDFVRNVVLVGVLHATFNFPALVVTNAPSDISWLVSLPVFVAIVWYYRRWAKERRPADFQPFVQVRRASASWFFARGE